MIQLNGDLIFLDGSGQVVAANGNLTLRADSTNTKSIIVGSGAAFRPDRDIMMDLGTSDLRWHRMHAGDIRSTSGVLGNLAFVGNTFLFNDSDIILDGGDFTIQDAGGLILDPTTTASFQGNVSFEGTTTFLTDLLPGQDALVGIGRSNLRFNRINAVSGVFNHIQPQASGSFMTVGGHLYPDRTNVYHLGENARRWASIFATSGNITTLTSSTLNTGTVVASIVNTDVLVATTGNITEVFSDSIENSTYINTDNIAANTAAIGDIQTDTLTVQVAAQFNGSAAFTSRPTVNGSGVCLQKENYFEVYGGRVLSFSNPSTLAELLVTFDGTSAGAPDTFFTVQQDVHLEHFTMMCVHLDAAQPPPWTVRLRINSNADGLGGVDHASGAFVWNTALNALTTTYGSWSGTQTIPAGSRCRLIVDSNGQTGHNTTFAKAWLGFTVVSGVR